MDEQAPADTQAPAGSPAPARSRPWVVPLVEAGILVSSVVYLVGSELGVLVVWEVLTLAYLVGGLVVAWRGSERPAAVPRADRLLVRWMWLPVVLSACTGANAAVFALMGSGGPGVDRVSVVTSTLAIVLSWGLLHVGFAQLYRLLAADSDGAGFRFPEGRPGSFMDLLYFAVTIGTSFATSDVELATVRLRRVVMLHSIVAFFYNTLVIAVVFQVLSVLLGS